MIRAVLVGIALGLLAEALIERALVREYSRIWHFH